MSLVQLLSSDGLTISADSDSGCVCSVVFDGEELLDTAALPRERLVNGEALDLRVAPYTWTNMADYPQCVVGAAVNEWPGGPR